MTMEEIKLFQGILPPEKLYALQKISFRQQNEANRQAIEQKHNANPDLITIDKRQVKAEIEKVIKEALKELGFK